jgi:hypothetical protein
LELQCLSEVASLKDAGPPNQFHFAVPMNDSPKDEALHIVARDKSRPRLLETAVSITPPGTGAASPPKTRSLRKLLIFLVSILAIGAVAAGAIYWLRHEESVTQRPISVLKTIRQAMPTPPRPPVRVSSDLLHVSAIALGDVRLAIVNDKQLTEGDWLEVRTSDGVAALRVVKIEDGFVHFGYAGQTIDAKLTTPAVQKEPRKP